MKAQNGLTLIEILIAITILAALALFSGRIVIQALQSREKASQFFSTHAVVRDALKTIERDINFAFNYRDFHTAIYNAAAKEFHEYMKKKKAQKKPGSTTPTPGAPPAAEPGSPPVETDQQEEQLEEKYKARIAKPSLSQFVGNADSVHLTTSSYTRTTADELAGDQAEVGYFLGTCRDPFSEQSSQCLFRRATPYIDNDVTDGGDPIVLLSNVKKFALRYLGPGDTDWVKEWDSTGRGKENQKGKFPAAVEVDLAIDDPRTKKETELRIVAQVRFANNAPASDAQANPQEPGVVGAPGDINANGVPDDQEPPPPENL